MARYPEAQLRDVSAPTSNGHGRTVTGKIPPNTLELVRGFHASMQAAQVKINETMTVLIEAHGHDIAAVDMTRIDLDKGEYDVTPKTRQEVPASTPATVPVP